MVEGIYGLSGRSPYQLQLRDAEQQESSQQVRICCFLSVLLELSLTYRKRIQPLTTHKYDEDRAVQDILDILHHRPAQTLPAQVVPGPADVGDQTRLWRQGVKAVSFQLGTRSKRPWMICWCKLKDALWELNGLGCIIEI